VVLAFGAVQRVRRLNEIVAIVTDHGGARVADLAVSLKVSEPTIRRDLEYLEKHKLVRRTHGGASSHDEFNDVPLGLKTAQDVPEKRRIARAALSFVDGARVIGMNGGTTLTEFAHAYRDVGAASVVTNALDVATELLTSPRIRVFLVGGEVRPSSHETVGRSAEVLLATYNIDVAVLGVDGIDVDAGATAYDPSGAAVNAIICQRAHRSIVLADATKVARAALARICPLDEVDVLITDQRASPTELDRIRAHGCHVVVV
jgi:DeoR family transcriptional regulator of aga operon